MSGQLGQMRNTHFIRFYQNAQDALRAPQLNLRMAPMKIGDQIRKIRKAKGLKLSEVENRAGLSEGNLSRVERGVQWLSEEKLYALAAALDVPPAQFFGHVEPAPGQVDPDVLIGIVTVLRGLTAEDQRLALAQVENVGLVAASRARRTAADQSQ